MSRDTAALGFALGRGCTADDAARFAIYFQAQQLSELGKKASLSQLYDDWQNLLYVERMERFLSGPAAA